MLRVAANTHMHALHLKRHKIISDLSGDNKPEVISQKTKFLAWGIFLFYFIESGTLGLIPSNFYFIYRNIRISDFLLYGLTVYSLFCTPEYKELYRSKTTIILKLMLAYLLVQFFVSCILYDYNIIEYFFRLKGIWVSFMIFPFLLLLKRNGLPYLIKLVLPVAIISNILYILSSVTGTAFLPGVDIEKQTLPGGFEVYRVFGGTFFGELFFLGFIYQWFTDKFRFSQLFLVLLFAIPHILAFGRSAWLYFVMTIFVIFVWHSLRNKQAKTVMRQIIVVAVLVLSVYYVFNKYVPRADYLTDAIGARIQQGEDDIRNKEGTYGSRLASIDMLIQLWLNNNIVFGVGMHPMWVVRPLTVEENLYAWGFSDVAWAAVLAGYGIIGLLLALFFQVYYIVISYRILKFTRSYDLYTFLVIVFFSRLLFDSIINYAYGLITSGLWGFPTAVMFLAPIVYKYEHINDEPATG